MAGSRPYRRQPGASCDTDPYPVGTNKPRAQGCHHVDSSCAHLGRNSESPARRASWVQLTVPGRPGRSRALERRAVHGRSLGGPVVTGAGQRPSHRPDLQGVPRSMKGPVCSIPGRWPYAFSWSRCPCSPGRALLPLRPRRRQPTGAMRPASLLLPWLARRQRLPRLRRRTKPLPCPTEGASRGA